MIEFSITWYGHVLDLMRLPDRYPVGFGQLLLAATLGMGVIAVLSWANYRQPEEKRFAKRHNPVQLIWIFEILLLVILFEWFILLNIPVDNPDPDPFSI
jgi:hypothetical protein